MNKPFRWLAVLLAASTLMACGGSDDPSAAETLDGQWTGILRDVSPKDCSLGPLRFMPQTHQVSVNGGTVTVDVISQRYQGPVTGNNAFDATTVITGLEGQTTSTISYRNANLGRADVTLSNVRSLADGPCTTTYSGVMTR